MEYFYVIIDSEDVSLNKNTFPLKFVFLCFLYLIISISMSNRMIEKKPVINTKIKNDFNFQENLFPFNKFETGENDTYFNITKIDYKFSYEFNIVKIEYYIGMYDKNDKLIIPSNLGFYYNLHLMCNLQIPSNNLTIESMAGIYNDKYHRCVEFFKIKENVKIGLKIYRINENMDNKYFFLFDDKRFNLYNTTFQNDDYFNPTVIKDKYDLLIDTFRNMRINETLKFRKTYQTYPYSTLKREALLSSGRWQFRNLYNEYFCICKGDSCLKINVTEKCKYYFYISIIDSNRYVYNKTEYAFMDFIKADLSSDDTYPVFKEMLKKFGHAHYITESLDLYDEHCGNEEHCTKIMLTVNDDKPFYGDFVEKYISIFLKLKSLISGRPSFNTDLFYFMEYVTYVCVGHGICYFKPWLFNPERIYGIRRNDKIILPDSDILVDIVKKYGWKEEDIFRVNLPRWDKLYDMEQENLKEAEKEKQERIKNEKNQIYQQNQIQQYNQYNQTQQNLSGNHSYQNQYYQLNQNIQNNNINNYNYSAINNQAYQNQINQYNNSNNNINNQYNQNIIPVNKNNVVQDNQNQIVQQNMPIISITNNITNNNITNNQNQSIINLTESQNNITETKRKIKTNSILMMFTWRDLQPGNVISSDYFRNFYYLVGDEVLYKELEKHNITVYLSFHRLVREKDIIKFKDLIQDRPLIEYIGQHEISECLGRTSLVVTDFSSIIFDLMFRKKPYIIYIPDCYDSSLKKIYKPDYWGLIEAMKNNTIKFENKIFSVYEAVDKIIFYIENNFALDEKLERFYQKFGFKMEKSIDKFIDYLVKLN